MNYSFITDNIKSLVSGLRVDTAALELLLASRDDSFILNHNKDAIASLLAFLNGSENNIFVLNGFMGAGKTSVADFILNFISEDVLVFKNSYQEAINLDDILLSLFEDFSVYHRDKKIQLPKVETNVFSEKINAYIKSCNAPMFFVFDSFEINMRQKDSQQDILDFINYLSHFEKIKILIVSRTFKDTDLLSPIGAISYKLVPLSKSDVFAYLQKNQIDGSNYEKESLYKVTRGHFLLLELSVLIMNLLGLSLNLFSNEYKKSTKNFLEFLISKLFSTGAEKFIKLLMFMTVIRHGVSANFLMFSDFATMDNLSFLISKRIVSKKYGKYYLKDYLKNEFVKSINIPSRIKVHQFLIELYENELPLKPFERRLFLSRQTMRQEIAHHKNKIKLLQADLVKTGKTPVTETQDFNYLSYSRTSGYEEKEAQRKVRQKRYIDEIKKNTPNNSALSKEDSEILNSLGSSDDVAQNFFEIATQEQDEIDNAINEDFAQSEDLVPDNIDDYVKIAENYETAYNYSSAILYYKKALSYTIDPTFEAKKPILYEKLANCYKQIQNIDEATELYEKIYSIYSSQDKDKANEVLFTVAHMYCEVFKYDKAKEYFKRVLYSPLGVSSPMVIRVYLDISDIEYNNMDTEAALKNAQKALVEAEKNADVKLITECYFKCAVLFDDSNNVDMASKYYLRCVQISNNPKENNFIASAYANLAEISADSGNISAAKMYFDLSIEADKIQNNLEGLYYSYTKLANLYKKDDLQKTYELLVKSLSVAKHMDDVNFAASSYIEIGDYYMNINEFKQALKSYILAKRLVDPNSIEDLSSKINARISKIKTILGEEMYNNIVEEIKNHK